MVGYGVNAQPDNLTVTLLKFRLEASHIAELSGTNRREILGVGKQYSPAIPNPLVKIHRSLCRLHRKIGSFLPDMYCNEQLGFSGVTPLCVRGFSLRVGQVRGGLLSVQCARKAFLYPHQELP